MAISSTLHGASRSEAERKRPAAVPREHGAWFMLGHCLIAGAVVSRSGVLPALLVAAASYSVFLSMQGVQRVARQLRNPHLDARPSVPRSSAAFLGGAMVAGAAAVFAFELPVLLPWGVIGLLLIALHTAAVFARRERSVLGEWAAILGLTVSAGAAWSAGTGRLGTPAFLLWGLCFLYFAGTVPYVKLRVRQSREPRDAWSERLMQAAPALAYAAASLLGLAGASLLGLVPPLAVVPFAFAAVKVLGAAARGRPPRRIAHVGYAEIGFSTAFTVLVILAF